MDSLNASIGSSSRTPYRRTPGKKKVSDFVAARRGLGEAYMTAVLPCLGETGRLQLSAFRLRSGRLAGAAYHGGRWLVSMKVEFADGAASKLLFSGPSTRGFRAGNFFGGQWKGCGPSFCRAHSTRAANALAWRVLTGVRVNWNVIFPSTQTPLTAVFIGLERFAFD